MLILPHRCGFLALPWPCPNTTECHCQETSLLPSLGAAGWWPWVGRVLPAPLASLAFFTSHSSQFSLLAAMAFPKIHRLHPHIIFTLKVGDRYQQTQGIYSLLKSPMLPMLVKFPNSKINFLFYLSFFLLFSVSQQIGLEKEISDSGKLGT